MQPHPGHGIAPEKSSCRSRLGSTPLLFLSLPAPRVRLLLAASGCMGLRTTPEQVMQVERGRGTF
jgi:hypothetical protein